MKKVILLVLMTCMGLMNAFAQEKEECRLKVEDLKPIIQRLNPFFANHTWDNKGQIEMAQMGEKRLILITQDGCKRHHTRFSLLIDASELKEGNTFWIKEAENLLHKVYWENPDYSQFGMAFNEKFTEKFAMYGLGKQFNFPLGTRNFICRIDKDSERGGRITIEMVTFIFKEKVQPASSGIPPKEDDGWRQ
ncbi:MAG: hypothetical protein MRZ79_02250 [Bacteroidia bacterium]|nr:hypothetical protein [Bacteroidia bacterium]